MKVSFLLLVALTASAFASETVIPVSFSKDRYGEMARQCPFGLETVGPERRPDAPNPFANIVLRGLGSDYVVIQRHGDDHTIRLCGAKEEEGFKVTKVNWSKVWGESTVELTDGTFTDTVRFDQNLIHNPAPAAPAVKNLQSVGGYKKTGSQPVKGPPGVSGTSVFSKGGR